MPAAAGRMALQGMDASTSKPSARRWTRTLAAESLVGTPPGSWLERCRVFVPACFAYGVSMRIVRAIPLLLTASLLGASAAEAGDGPFGWLSGDWYLTVGATGMVAPNFEGGKKYMLSAQPIISLGKAGPQARFTSRNDNISLALVDDGGVRAGLTGKFLFSRDDSDADELKGLDPVRWGGEVGGFFEFYPTDWMRARAELRHGGTSARRRIVRH